MGSWLTCFRGSALFLVVIAGCSTSRPQVAFQRQAEPTPGPKSAPLPMPTLGTPIAQPDPSPISDILRTSAQVPATDPLVPIPSTGSEFRELPPASATAVASGIPVSLDTVFRLAQDKNGQLHIARTKLLEATIEHDIANRRWLPDLSVGVGGWRHEGGIQDFQGRLVHSSYGGINAGLDVRGKFDWRDVVFQRFLTESKVWRERTDVSRLTNEQLLDAATTYIDLLAATTGEKIGIELEALLEQLSRQSATLVKVEPGLRVEKLRVDTEWKSQQVLNQKFRDGSMSALAKLKYLLGLDQTVELVPFENRLDVIRLVEAGQPAEILVEQSLRQGPSVQELAGLLSVMERMQATADSNAKWLPVVEVGVGEGLLLAGPGSRLSGDNRLDMAVQLRWNLSEAFVANEKRRQLDARAQQVHLTYHDVRNRLTMGVHEARHTILSGMNQLKLAEEHIKSAEESLNVSQQRFTESIKGRSPSEVLLAIRSLAGARYEYLQTVRTIDKAQLRLFLLVGANDGSSSCARLARPVPAPGE